MLLGDIDIESLPTGKMERFGQYGHIKAVYFLYVGEEIVYIGSTLDLAARLRTHNSSRRFKHCGQLMSVRWLDCTSIHRFNLSLVERYFLGLFSPPYCYVHTRRSKIWPLTDAWDAGYRKPWHTLQNISFSRLTTYDAV